MIHEVDESLRAVIERDVIGKDDVELLQRYVARFGKEEIRSLTPSNGWRIPKSKTMLSQLLDFGADINARDWFGRTYLHHCCANNHDPDFAQIFVGAGINVDAIDHQSGTTALGLAAWCGSLGLVDLLLNAGAKSDLPSNAIWALPITFAKSGGYEEIVKRLQAHG